MCWSGLVAMEVLLPKLGSPVSPGRGETAYIFDSVAFMSQYPRTLCAYTTALCTVFVTTTSSSVFNDSQVQPSFIKHSFHPRVSVCHWGPPCSSDYFADVPKKWKQPSEGHPCISSLSASPFSHRSACHICWEGCPKRGRDDLQNGKGFFFYR